MTKSPGDPLGQQTKLSHLGRDPQSQHGFVNTPVYHGSTVLYPTVASLETRNQPYSYGRRGTPTIEALETALAELEGGARTVLTPSGLAAITTAVLSVVNAGDHILVTDSVYRPTRHFCDTVLTRLGVETTYYDPLIGSGIDALIRDNTRLVYAESPGSQTFEMQDLPAIAEAAHARDVLVFFDNTWGTALFCQPFALGADISIQAATKYIIGHADAMLGVVTANEKTAAALRNLHGTLGLCAGPDDVYLGLRGMRTMAVRLNRHSESALAMANWLREREEVSRVLHPALEDDPGHAIWKRDFTGSSGLFSVVLKPCSKDAIAAMLDDLALFGMGFSWGGFESLVVPFDPAAYRTATRWDAEGPALRFHIGLEDVADLQADLDSGFARLRAAS